MKISCNVIRDLLPSYIDEICSDDTKRLVEEHIGVCGGCKELFSGMKDTQVNMEGNEALQIDHMKKIRSRYNKMSLGSYLLLLMMLLPIIYFVCRNTYPLSDLLFMIVLPVMILAAFLTAGSDRTFSKVKCCLCVATCLLLMCEFVLMRTAFSWVTKETLPFGMELQNLGPFIRNVLLILMVGELAVLIYSIVSGRLKDTDNTYCAAISVTGIILPAAYINLLRQLTNLESATAAVNKITVVLTGELVILLICYAVVMRFRKLTEFRNG